MKTFLMFAVGSLIVASSYAQGEKNLWITAGTNFRLPVNSSVPVFPLLRNKKTANRKMILGGVGIGLSSFLKVSPKLQVRSTFYFSRQVYWNESVQLNKGPLQQDALGYMNSLSYEYYSESSGVLHYMFNDNLSIGAGVGFQFLLASRKLLDINTGDPVPTIDNHEFKYVMPVVPVEIAWRGNIMMYCIRAEAGLLNRYKKDLKEFGPNTFGLLCFEVGMKLF